MADDSAPPTADGSTIEPTYEHPPESHADPAVSSPVTEMELMPAAGGRGGGGKADPTSDDSDEDEGGGPVKTFLGKPV